MGGAGGGWGAAEKIAAEKIAAGVERPPGVERPAGVEWPAGVARRAGGRGGGGTGCKWQWAGEGASSPQILAQAPGGVAQAAGGACACGKRHTQSTQSGKGSTSRPQLRQGQHTPANVMASAVAFAGV